MTSEAYLTQQMAEPPFRPPGREFYPSHGEPPLSDTELQRLEREALFWVLARHFGKPSDPYVGADMFVYYEKGNRNKKVSPDLFVCFGVGRQMRRVYKTWEDDHGLDWVLEVVSSGTWKNDVGKKRQLYAERLGVQEYFVYDPEGKYLKSAPLLRYARQGGALEPVAPPASGHHRSVLLGLDLIVRPFKQHIGRWRLDFHLPDGTRLLRSNEALELEQSEREREEKARKAAQRRARKAKMDQLSAEVARQAAEAAQQAAEAARQAAEAAQQAAEAARQAAEAENLRLREELDRLRASGRP